MDLAIGDEQTPGYKPQALNNKEESKVLTQALGTKTISKGVKDASLTIKGKSNVLHQLNQFSLPAYDRIFLFYGMNDYLKSNAGLDEVSHKLAEAIHVIRRKNPWVQIYGILPLPMYDKNGKPDAKQLGRAKYTLQDLMTMLRITYSDSGVKSLNWMTLNEPIITRNNYKQRLKAGRYPTQRTYQLMADRIGKFVKRHLHSGQQPSIQTVHGVEPISRKVQGHKHVVSFGDISDSNSTKKDNNEINHKKGTN